MITAAGPLGRSLDPGKLDTQASKANALILLRRVALVDEQGSLEQGDELLLDWAATCKLGQGKTLIAHVGARRAAALERLREQYLVVHRMHATPEWRLLVGHGERANPHEIGIALHGTYGWPVIPATTLKGVARRAAPEGEDRDRVLGTPDRGQGSVRFLDAIPASGAVAVQRDVLTPHQQPWYTGGKEPAEHHNPVPVGFLVVTGTFAVDLVGADRADLTLAAQWLSAAAEDIGVGAKTGVGYGYLTMSDPP